MLTTMLHCYDSKVHRLLHHRRPLLVRQQSQQLLMWHLLLRLWPWYQHDPPLLPSARAASQNNSPLPPVQLLLLPNKMIHQSPEQRSVHEPESHEPESHEPEPRHRHKEAWRMTRCRKRLILCQLTMMTCNKRLNLSSCCQVPAVRSNQVINHAPNTAVHVLVFPDISVHLSDSFYYYAPSNVKHQN
jgi:hypothetical protein